MPRLLARRQSGPAAKPDSVHLARAARAGKRRVSRTNLPRLVAQAAPVPVYGTNDFYIGSGVVGGVVRETYETGTRAGEMALPDSQRDAGPGYSDRRRARSYPPSTGDRFCDGASTRRGCHRNQTFDSGRRLSGNPIAGTSWEHSSWSPRNWCSSRDSSPQRTNRRRAEAAIRRSEASLRASYERIRQMAGRLINAQEAARADIARDLHDDVCQQLVYVSMGVSTLKNSSGDIQDAQTQQAFSDLERDTLGRSRASGVCRTICIPHPSEYSALAPALKTHCAEVGSGTTSRSRSTPATLDTCILILPSVSSESLKSRSETAVSHGEAKRFDVSLSRFGEHIEHDGHRQRPGIRSRGRAAERWRARPREHGGASTRRGRRCPNRHRSRTGTTIRVRGPVEPPKLTSQPA